jgi:hypothetical protein
MSERLSMHSSFFASAFTEPKLIHTTTGFSPLSSPKWILSAGQTVLTVYFLARQSLAVRTLVQTSYIVRWDWWPTSHRFVPFGCGLVVNSAPIGQSGLLGPHTRCVFPGHTILYSSWFPLKNESTASQFRSRTRECIERAACSAAERWDVSVLRPVNVS